MMFSLNTNSIRDVLKRRGARSLSPHELPRYASEHLGLHAINFTTDLLKGMDTASITRIRDEGDRCGCACLMLEQSDALPIGDMNDKKALDAIDRMRRVVKAAGLLGCNAVSVRIKAADEDVIFERAVKSMKRVLESADDAEMNVLIAPEPGLTEDPERLTELVKSIGGFRIGTMPDFETAVASGDPVPYLKKLTPYASVVNASTLGFEIAEPAAERDEDAAPTGLDELAAELEGMMDAPPPEHVGFDLNAVVGAIVAVGFDGNIALDYRGEGDGTLGVLHAREAIEAAIDAAKES